MINLWCTICNNLVPILVFLAIAALAAGPGGIEGD